MRLQMNDNELEALNTFASYWRTGYTSITNRDIALVQSLETRGVSPTHVAKFCGKELQDIRRLFLRLGIARKDRKRGRPDAPETGGAETSEAASGAGREPDPHKASLLKTLHAVLVELETRNQ
jgi:hypothetical protein